jgi:hypothetical protein
MQGTANDVGRGRTRGSVFRNVSHQARRATPEPRRGGPAQRNGTSIDAFACLLAIAALCALCEAMGWL